MSKNAGKQCCCHWGAAVSGEYPEWACPACERHGADGWAAPGDECKRHAAFLAAEEENDET